MRIILKNNAEIDYLHFGSGKKLFVILPGICLLSVVNNDEIIQQIFDDFCKDYQVYLFTYNNNFLNSYSIEQMANDIAEAMRQLNIENAYIFGASQGGMIAQILAIQHKDLVKKVVLASTLSKQNVVSTEVFNEWKRLSDLGDAIKLNQYAFSKIYSKDYLIRHKDAFNALEKMGTKDQLINFGKNAVACRNFNCFNQLNKITCPVFVIGSRKDSVTSIEGTLELIEALKCKYYIYDDYSHAVFDEDINFHKHLHHFFKE